MSVGLAPLDPDLFSLPVYFAFTLTHRFAVAVADTSGFATVHVSAHFVM